MPNFQMSVETNFDILKLILWKRGLRPKTEGMHYSMPRLKMILLFHSPKSRSQVNFYISNLVHFKENFVHPETSHSLHCSHGTDEPV